MLTRRSALIGAAALGGCVGHIAPAVIGPTGREREAAPRIAAIEARIGGRIGLAAIDTSSEARILYREHELFAMCSTFKWVLAAQILKLCEGGGLTLDQRIRYARADLLPHSPVTEAHVGDGAMSLEALCEAAVTVSDNCAANLLLVPAMGPAGFTRFVRENGDSVTRLDRTEPTLNENLPGDVRDTTSPLAMAQAARRFLTGETTIGGVEFGPALNEASRLKLLHWMEQSATGLERLRAGLPQNWRAGDKTGTGARGAANDVAILWPPGRRSILIASYLSGSTAPLETLNAAHADIARIVAEIWA